MALREETAW